MGNKSRIGKPKPARIQEPIPPSRRVLFSVLMLLLPVLFFVVLEGGLRLAGYGESLPLFISFPDQPAYRYQNPQVGRRYFGEELSIPGSNLDFFKAHKAPDGYRIFVLGGSTAAGFPFYRGGSFPRMLERRIQATFPRREIEVVNTGMAAVNSYALLDFTDEILAYEPDAILVYAGHNEYYGALGVGSSQSVAPFPGLVRLYLKLRRFRTVQMLRQLVSGVVGATTESREFGHRATMMERMVREQEIPYGSPLFEQGMEQFRGNLRRIVTAFVDKNVPVYIGTLASNERDQPPFSVGLSPETDPDQRDERLRQVRVALEDDPDRARMLLENCIGADSADAEAWYLLGRVLLGQGDSGKAGVAFRRARRFDPLRFRAPEEANAIIREVATSTGAGVVEVERAMRRASSDDLIGSEMMIEHLHPTLRGLSLMANVFYDALAKDRRIGEWSPEIRSRPVMNRHSCTPVDSLVGRFRIRRLMAGWPFVPAGSQGDPLEGLEPADRIEELALATYVDGMDWQRAMVQQIQVLESDGRAHDAAQVAIALAEEYPFNASGHMLAANMLVPLQRYEEALYYFREANALEPTPEAERLIGSINLQLGRRVEAIVHLERAVEMQPRNTQGLYNLAGAYAMENRHEEARQTIARLLEIAPDHVAGRRLLGSLP